VAFVSVQSAPQAPGDFLRRESSDEFAKLHAPPLDTRKESKDMKARILLGTLTAAGIALGVGQMTATAVPGDGGTSDAQAGPDVIVGAIPDVARYGATTVGGVNIMAYAFGSTSCNIGTSQLSWYANTANHPVIPQNAYRIKNGRIEQIGMSWMKYGFCALQQTLCGTCAPAGSGCPSLLGIGCSDPYTASLNGTQGDLGPRSKVNPSTGVFPADVTSETTTWPAIPSGQGTIGRRVQIKADDLNPALNSGAVYLAECQYIHPEDASNNNDNNNSSYRLFTVGGTVSSGTYPITLSGATFQQKPAIFHYTTVVPTATITTVDATDGRYIVACNVSNNGNGTHRYEYAILNLNSDRAGASFSVPVPANVTITNAGFKDIAYHSGEAFDGTDWTFSVAGGQAKWQCTQTFAQNPNANALRWSTLYNFWFDASVPAATGNGSIGHFKVAGSTAVSMKVPSNPCRAGDLDCNGIVDGADLGGVLAAWGNCSAPCAADLDGNGVVNGADLGIQLSQWGTGS
jgi:hypothetical protein